MQVPEGGTIFEFGAGILEAGDPVKFKVVVKCEDFQKEVFVRDIVNNNKWYDEKIDISEWSGKSIEIILETESSNGNIAFWSNPIIYQSPEEKFNVIIVLEDALRADHLSCYGYSEETTPVKDALVKNGVLFLNAISQSTTTRSSCVSLMTSLYPTATGVWNFSEMLDDNYLTLAEIMRNQGFATGSFIQNGNSGPFAGLHQGFSNIFDLATVGSRADQMYGDKLYEWIASNLDRNIFLYIHIRDPHGIYDPPPPFDSQYREAPPGKTPVIKTRLCDPDWVVTPTLEGRRYLYDGEIRYNDFHFSRFLEKLKEYGLLDDTLLVFIADHGEFLGEHGLWTHYPPGYLQVLNVPMLLICPRKLPEDVKISQPVQLVDIMPTILELGGINRDNFLIQGDSLLPLIYGKDQNFWDSRFAISEEVFDKDRDDENEWASIFFNNRHIINSNRFFSLSWGLKTFFNIDNFPEFALGTRVFNYLKDREEEHYLNSYFIDIFLKYRFKHFIRIFQKNNMEIWRALTDRSEETIIYDPEELKELRALGYL